MSDFDPVYQRRIIEAKLKDSLIPGFVTLFTEAEALAVGAFTDDAIDFETARQSAIDAWEIN